jgi:3-mercaptopyruvate sulfurtransferase SseA
MDRYFMLNPAVDDKEEQVMDVLDNISLLVVDHRDTRRYADVLNNAPAVSEAGIGPNALLYNNL